MAHNAPSVSNLIEEHNTYIYQLFDNVIAQQIPDQPWWPGLITQIMPQKGGGEIINVTWNDPDDEWDVNQKNSTLKANKILPITNVTLAATMNEFYPRDDEV